MFSLKFTRTTAATALLAGVLSVALPIAAMSGPIGFTGTTWELASVDGAALSADPSSTTIRFDSGRYSVVADCNGGSGRYRYGPRPKLELAPGPFSAMECNTSVGSTFEALLFKVDTLERTPEGLVLTTSDGHKLLFYPAK